MYEFETNREIITNSDFKNLAIDVIEARINDLEDVINELELKKIMQGLASWQRDALRHAQKNLEINVNVMKVLNPAYRIKN